jgi:hypothetical protein
MADATVLVSFVGVVGTIAGTAVGAVIAARSTTAVERKREARLEREASSALQGAARLVWLDIALVEANLLWAVNAKEWHPAKVRLPMDAWERHREQLSVAITDPGAWNTIAVAMAGLAHLRGSVGEAWTEPRTLPPGMIDAFVEARRLSLAAASALRPYAALPPEAPSEQREPITEAT